MDKRTREEEDGEAGDSKRQFLSPLKKQMTPEELEQFQKEAIYRQLNVYRRERDALQEELNALQNDAKYELQLIRQKYLEAQRLDERPESELPVKTAEKNEEGDSKPAGTPSDGGVEMEKLQEELAGQRGTIVAQNAQIEKLQSQVTELEAKIRELQMAIDNPTEEMLAKSVAFKSTSALVEDLKSDNMRLEQELKVHQQAAATEKHKASNAEFEARQRSFERVQELEKKLENSENDVARLRAARDDKISEINVLKAAESTRMASLENLKELQKIADEKAKGAPAPETVSADTNTDNMSLEELKRYSAKLAKTNRILSAELPSVEQAYSKAHAKAMAKIQDQASIEAKINAAQVSKAKADEKFFGAMRAKDALQAEMARMKASLAKSAQLLSSLRENETKMHNQAQKLDKQLSDGDQKYSQLQRDLVASERRRSEIEASLSAIQQTVNTLKEQLKTRDSDVAFAAEKRRGLETQVEKLRKQLEIKRTTSGSGAVQEQLESLRTVALCSLCTNNWKNTALKVCGHVFCSECATARLSSRMRKCPLCNSQFGHNDLLTVHL